MTASSSWSRWCRTPTAAPRPTPTGTSRTPAARRGGVATGTTVTLDPGAYTIGETTGPAGYTLTGPTCTTGLSGSVVTLPVATLVTCTFTNTDSPTKLTLQKLVVGAPGVGPESWTLTATKQSGGPAVLSGNGGASGNITPNTPFVLAETTVPGFPNGGDFTAGAWECNTNNGGWGSHREWRASGPDRRQRHGVPHHEHGEDG